jgi:uncharacterized membrane protein
MLSCTKRSILFLFLLPALVIASNHAFGATDTLTLYTPYTRISLPPGESVEYTIDVINNGKKTHQVDLSVSGMPRGWNYNLKSGGWNISQISVLPGEKKSLSLKVDVPFQVEKGNYSFRVNAGKYGSLPLVINISKQGTYKTEFSATQSNMQGHAGSTFTFSANLRNRTEEKQLYALMAEVARGWVVTFKSGGRAVTSVDVEPNSTANVTIEVNPPTQVDARTYKIPVTATTKGTSASLDLEVVITGTYQMELTTPTGLLSTKVTAGDQRKIELQLRNTGTSELLDIKLLSTNPSGWEVTFEPKSVIKLMPNDVTHVYATIKADKKAIPGDYVINMEAKTPEVSAKAAFRVAVETSMLWGWMGVLVIVLAIGCVYYLFRKYGRR